MCGGACAGTTDVWGRLRVGDGFPPSETFEQPSFPRTTVIPAKAGIQGWGFPARNAGHLRHAVSRNGSYAKVSFRGMTGVGCAGACMTDVGVPGGERRMFGRGCVLGMDSRFRRPLNNRHSREQPSFPRRRESRAGGSLLGMLGISATLSPATGVTQRSPFAGTTGVGCLRGNDGCLGALRVGDGFPLSETFEQPSNNRHSREGGNPGLGVPC